jgi:hypothetical protein
MVSYYMSDDDGYLRFVIRVLKSSLEPMTAFSMHNVEPVISPRVPLSPLRLLHVSDSSQAENSIQHME